MTCLNSVTPRNSFILKWNRMLHSVPSTSRNSKNDGGGRVVDAQQPQAAPHRQIAHPQPDPAVADFDGSASGSTQTDITRGLRTDLFEDGVIRPRGRNHALTRRSGQRRDSETLGPKAQPFVEGRLVAGRATVGERDNGTAERA